MHHLYHIVHSVSGFWHINTCRIGLLRGTLELCRLEYFT